MSKHQSYEQQYYEDTYYDYEQDAEDELNDDNSAWLEEARIDRHAKSLLKILEKTFDSLGRSPVKNISPNSPGAYRPERDVDNGLVRLGVNGVFAYEGDNQFWSRQGGGSYSLRSALTVADFFFDQCVIEIEETGEVIEY